MLSFPEEVVLLLLDETRGEFLPLPESVFAIVMGGAALMDLALHNRVDTDLEKLMLVDRAPLGDDILDDVLAGLSGICGKQSEAAISEALYDAALDAEDYRTKALKSLIARGILKEENGRHLWVFRTRRYPVIDDSEQQEVRTRLRQVLLSEDIPDPRDIVLICLLDACVLMGFVLDENELEAATSRIEQLRKMDLIGQAVTRAASETEAIIKFAATTM
jgi:golgi phosphoprotein 3